MAGEDPDLKKKEKEAGEKDRRRKKEKKKDEGPKVRIGLEFDVEGPKVVRQPPKRGGCTSSASFGVIGPQISVKPTIEIEPGERKKEKKPRVVEKRPVRKGRKIGRDAVELEEVGAKGR